MYEIMPLPGKRAKIINEYMSTTLNNDKRDKRDLFMQCFQGYFWDIFAKTRDILNIWIFSQIIAVTGNRTCNLMVRKPMLYRLR